MKTLSRKIIFEGESLGDSTAYFFIIARKFNHHLLNPKLSKNNANYYNSDQGSYRPTVSVS